MSDASAGTGCLSGIRAGGDDEAAFPRGRHQCHLLRNPDWCQGGGIAVELPSKSGCRIEMVVRSGLRLFFITRDGDGNGPHGTIPGELLWQFANQILPRHRE